MKEIPVLHRLLNDFQRDFPLAPQPFAEAGRRLGMSERDVIVAFRRLRREGKIDRIGAILPPNRLGASTLAAMSVPSAALDVTAARISRFPGVNHNYEREHRFNLWFVVTAADSSALRKTLAEIEREAGWPLFPLPLVEAFHIDLGFPLSGLLEDNRVDAGVPPPPAAVAVTEEDRRLLAALQDGLPFVPRPYVQLAICADMTEESVVARIGAWLGQGLIRRFGVVVRHRALGYAANAMLVHDVPDEDAGRIGKALARDPGITLCYRRARAAPDWPYNLFCMIHGRERTEVAAYAGRLRERHGLLHLAHDVLFSRRCFKQTGARYA